jgi:hypothetical protein
MQSTTERLERLNRAYQKRTEAIRHYHERMRLIRNAAYRDMMRTRNETWLDWAKVTQEASRERDGAARAELEKEASAVRQMIEGFESQIANAEEQTRLTNEELQASLKAIDREIQALGGRLTVPPAESEASHVQH